MLVDYKKRDQEIAFQRSLGKSLSELAKMFGLKKPTIIHALKNFPHENEKGIEIILHKKQQISLSIQEREIERKKKYLEKRKRFEKIKEEILKIDDGKTHQKIIAEKVGCEQSTVSKVLIAAGRRRQNRRKFKK